MAKKVKLIEPSKVRARLLKLAANGKFEWSEVLTEFSEFNGNWLHIRGVLQGLINDQKIKRFPSVHVEMYLAI